MISVPVAVVFYLIFLDAGRFVRYFDENPGKNKLADPEDRNPLDGRTRVDSAFMSTHEKTVWQHLRAILLLPVIVTVVIPSVLLGVTGTDTLDLWQWVAHWNNLVEFEIVAVHKSKDAAASFESDENSQEKWKIEASSLAGFTARKDSSAPS